MHWFIVLAFSSLTVFDLDNRAVDPFKAAGGAKATVFLFTSTDCPISNRYAPEVQRVYRAFAPKGVRFFLVYPNPADTPDAVMTLPSSTYRCGVTVTVPSARSSSTAPQ